MRTEIADICVRQEQFPETEKKEGLASLPNWPKRLEIRIPRVLLFSNKCSNCPMRVPMIFHIKLIKFIHLQNSVIDF